MGYEFEVKYKAGVHNGAADALSRRDGAVELSSISIPIWLDLEGVDQAVQENPLLQQILKRLQQSVGVAGLTRWLMAGCYTRIDWF